MLILFSLKNVYIYTKNPGTLNIPGNICAQDDADMYTLLLIQHHIEKFLQKKIAMPKS